MKNKREKERKILQCGFQENIMMNDSMSGNQTARLGDINIYNIVISKTVLNSNIGVTNHIIIN